MASAILEGAPPRADEVVVDLRHLAGLDASLRDQVVSLIRKHARGRARSTSERIGQVLRQTSRLEPLAPSTLVGIVVASLEALGARADDLLLVRVLEDLIKELGREALPLGLGLLERRCLRPELEAEYVDGIVVALARFSWDRAPFLSHPSEVVRARLAGDDPRDRER